LSRGEAEMAGREGWRRGMKLEPKRSEDGSPRRPKIGC
jgi:hypothetical protein